MPPYRLLPLLLLVAARADAAEATLPIKLFDPAELGPRIAPSETTLQRIGPKGGTPGRRTHIIEPMFTAMTRSRPANSTWPASV